MNPSWTLYYRPFSCQTCTFHCRENHYISPKFEIQLLCENLIAIPDIKKTCFKDHVKLILHSGCLLHETGLCTCTRRSKQPMWPALHLLVADIRKGLHRAIKLKVLQLCQFYCKSIDKMCLLLRIMYYKHLNYAFCRVNCLEF